MEDQMTAEVAASITEVAASIVERIKPLLANRRADVQGAVLVELVSLYFAAHIPSDDMGEEQIEQMFTLFIDTVRELIPINRKMLLHRIKERSN